MVEIRLHGSLRDFRRDAGDGVSVCALDPQVRRSLADGLGSLGVPLAEVRLLTGDGEAVPPDALATPGVSYDAYPADCCPAGYEEHVRPLRPPGEATFVLDVHLGTLARRLRLLGFDVRYTTDDPGDAALAGIASSEQRIALSRDIGLLKRRVVRYGRWLRSRDPGEQLDEVLGHFALVDELQPFTRCAVCNGQLHECDLERARAEVPAGVADEYDRFWRCGGCGRVYWQGSHYEQLTRWLEDYLARIR